MPKKNQPPQKVIPVIKIALYVNELCSYIPYTVMKLTDILCPIVRNSFTMIVIYTSSRTPPVMIIPYSCYIPGRKIGLKHCCEENIAKQTLTTIDCSYIGHTVRLYIVFVEESIFLAYLKRRYNMTCNKQTKMSLEATVSLLLQVSYLYY